MRRLFWLAMGITIGVLVVRKLSSAAEKLTPGSIGRSIADSLGDLADAINADTGVNGSGTLQVNLGAGSAAQPTQIAFAATGVAR